MEWKGLIKKFPIFIYSYDFPPMSYMLLSK